MSTKPKPAKPETVAPDGLVGKYFIETERDRFGESVKLQGRVIRRIEDARYLVEIHTDGELPEEREFCRFDMRNWIFLPTMEKMNLRIETIR